MSILQSVFRPAKPDRFARQVTRRLRRAGVEGEIQFDPTRFLLRYGTDAQQIIYLGNFYAEYLAAPIMGRGKVFTRFMAAFTNKPAEDDSFDNVKGQLLPRVRERFYYQSFELNMLIDRAHRPPANPARPPLEDFINRPLNEELSVELVVDLPDSIRTVSKRDLTKWAVSFDDAMAIAKDNLWRASNQEFKRIRPGLFVSPWQDTHDASRLFLHDLIWQLPVRGDHVVAVPNRNLLIVTGSDDADNLVALAHLVDQAMQQPRPMIGQIFRLAGSQWHPFVPPPESPAHWPVKRLAMKSTARDYAEQKSLLESLHQKTGQDVFVASQTLMRRNDDTFWTWTCWVEGITDALMPVADFVSFGGINADGSSTSAGFARWDRVVEKVGHMMEPTTFYPPRYRIRAYPSGQELAGLELTKNPGI